MSELPTILVTNGWKTDRNRKLTEVVIPSTVKTLNAPTKVTFMGKTLSAVPSTAAALQEFEAPNCTSIPASFFKSYTKLTSISFASVTSLLSTGTSAGEFHSCTSLSSVNMPSLTTITVNNATSTGSFFNCTSLATIILQKLTSIIGSGGNYGGAFGNCTGLTSVQLGSEGYPVSGIINNTFYNCTQSGLTITIYTTGGASLSGAPWGATNATIVYETA